MSPRLDLLEECRDCGLLQHIPSLADGTTAVCARCRGNIHQSRHASVPISVLCAGIGLVLWGLSLLLPVASVFMPGGRFATSDLFQGATQLRRTGAWELEIAVWLTLLLLPALKLATVVAMGTAIALGRIPGWVRRCFGWLPLLSAWAMVEVFLLGATIALIRLRDWMRVDFGLGLFALGGVALCSIGVDAALDRRAFWRAVPLRVPALGRTSPSSQAAGRKQHPIGCAGCGLVSYAGELESCLRCGHRLRSRKLGSVGRVWAFIAAAALLAVPANALPVMTITKMGKGGPSTILNGTVELAQRGFVGLAILVFVASILVPAAKLLALATLLVMTARRSSKKLLLRTRLFRFVAEIGRWSMLDIYATMMLVALARFGRLGNVRPEPGAIAFCAVVIVTLLASESFDPRLMWDAAGENAPVRQPWRRKRGPA